jgi:hypothetical protein
LINHSCINNAFSINVGNKIVTILDKPVKAGDQIFYRYGKQLWLPVYKAMVKGEIEAKHNFKCDCEACNQSEESFFGSYFKKAGMDDNKMMYEPNQILEGDYELGKEKLKKYFGDINENPDQNIMFSDRLMFCQIILNSAAYLYNYSIPPHDKYGLNPYP